jgi:hypothetical protein
VTADRVNNAYGLALRKLILLNQKQLCDNTKGTKMRQFVICIDNSNYPVSFERRKLYEVVEDDSAADHNQTRVIDESGEDYLFPKNIFLDLRLSDDIASKIPISLKICL